VLTKRRKKIGQEDNRQAIGDRWRGKWGGEIKEVR
jgi:hypothetical protein